MDLLWMPASWIDNSSSRPRLPKGLVRRSCLALASAIAFSSRDRISLTVFVKSSVISVEVEPHPPLPTGLPHNNESRTGGTSQRTLLLLSPSNSPIKAIQTVPGEESWLFPLGLAQCGARSGQPGRRQWYKSGPASQRLSAARPGDLAAPPSR